MPWAASTVVSAAGTPSSAKVAGVDAVVMGRVTDMKGYTNIGMVVQPGADRLVAARGGRHRTRPEAELCGQHRPLYSQTRDPRTTVQTNDGDSNHGAYHQCT